MGSALASRGPHPRRPTDRPPQVMHALVFSMKLRYAAPLQLATCAPGAHACRGLACLVRSDAMLTAAARRLCMAAFSVKGAALLALGPMAIGLDARQVCGEKSMELLIPLFSALPCFASVSGGWRLEGGLCDAGALQAALSGWASHSRPHLFESLTPNHPPIPLHLILLATRLPPPTPRILHALTPTPTSPAALHHKTALRPLRARAALQGALPQAHGRRRAGADRPTGRALHPGGPAHHARIVRVCGGQRGVWEAVPVLSVGPPTRRLVCCLYKRRLRVVAVCTNNRDIDLEIVKIWLMATGPCQHRLDARSVWIILSCRRVN